MWPREELFYCSNVHRGETLVEVQDVISTHIPAVMQTRSLQSMASGLWLSQHAAEYLGQEQARLAEFRESLDKNKIRLMSLNGFPYGDFHSASVKEKVYEPDWSDPRRLQYTLTLAGILADCLPQPLQTGTISTLPLGARRDWSAEKQQQALRALCQAAGALERLQEDTGHSIRICLEMEPGCVLEYSDDIIRLFRDELPPAAKDQGIEMDAIMEHLGVCFDVCHQAIMFENPYDSLQRIHQSGIGIGKIQLSSALDVACPDSDTARAALSAFEEPRYLHQVYARTGDGQIQGVMDLPAALSGKELPVSVPWRVHFHVPIQAATLANEALGTTQDAIKHTLDFLAATPEVHPHLEVETYTWQVLPEQLRPRDDAQLHNGLAAELDWLEQQMQQRGLVLQ